MARPKLNPETKKVKMNLTISPEAKEIAEIIRSERNISVSELLEEYLRKEYQKLQKKQQKK